MGTKPHQPNQLKRAINAYLVLGALPKGASYISRVVRDLRAHVQKAVLDKYGSVSLPQGLLIQSACRHESQVLLLAKWLRDNPDAPLAIRSSLLRDLSRATDCRDRALMRLNLDMSVNAKSAWDEVLDITPADEGEPGDGIVGADDGEVDGTLGIPGTLQAGTPTTPPTEKGGT